MYVCMCKSPHVMHVHHVMHVRHVRHVHHLAAGGRLSKCTALHVCMCTYACTHVHVYVCMYVCVRTDVCVCTSYRCVCVRTYMCVYARAGVRVCICVCTYVQWRTRLPFHVSTLPLAVLVHSGFIVHSGRLVGQWAVDECRESSRRRQLDSHADRNIHHADHSTHHADLRTRRRWGDINVTAVPVCW